MSKIKNLINSLRPKGRPGRLPKITPCPYCGAHLSQTAHAKHRSACAAQSPNSPRPAAELSQDPGSGYNKDGTFPQT